MPMPSPRRSPDGQMTAGRSRRCRPSPSIPHRHHGHAPLPAPAPLPSPGWCLNHKASDAEAFPAQDQHGVGSWLVAGARRRCGRTDFIAVNASLLGGAGWVCGLVLKSTCSSPRALGFFFIDSLITFVSAAYLGGFAMNCIHLPPLWQYLLC